MHAASAAHLAACEAAGTNFLESLGSDHDAAANAAIAEAGGWYEDPDGSGPDYYDTQRLYGYWRLWLTAAVPAAWVDSAEANAASSSPVSDRVRRAESGLLSEGEPTGP
jgi:hypothetical protein